MGAVSHRLVCFANLSFGTLSVLPGWAAPRSVQKREIPPDLVQRGEPVAIIVAKFTTPSFDERVQGLDRSLKRPPGRGPGLEHLEDEPEGLVVGLKNIQPNIAATIGGPVRGRHALRRVGGLAGESQHQLRPLRSEPRPQPGIGQTVRRGGDRRDQLRR